MSSKRDVLYGLELATVHVLEGDYGALACETPTDGLRIWVSGIPAYTPYAQDWINPIIPVRKAYSVSIEWCAGFPLTNIDIVDEVGYHRYYCKQYTLHNDPEKFWQEVNH